MALEVRNLSTKRTCKTNVGSLYISSCDDFSHVFNPGICFISGEIYDGGWSVTDFLSREEKGDMEGMELVWNGDVITPEEIRNRVYYVSNNDNNYEKNHRTVEGNILHEYKLKQVDCETFLSMAKLDWLGTGDRMLSRTGHAFWYYSALIGIASGREIVTFPWMSGHEFEVQGCRFRLLAELCWRLGCIVIIPAEAEGIDSQIPRSRAAGYGPASIRQMHTCVSLAHCVRENKRNLPWNPRWYEVIHMKGGILWN